MTAAQEALNEARATLGTAYQSIGTDTAKSTAHLVLLACSSLADAVGALIDPPLETSAVDPLDDLTEKMTDALSREPRGRRFGDGEDARICTAVAHEHYADLVAAAKELHVVCEARLTTAGFHTVELQADRLRHVLAALEAAQPEPKPRDRVDVVVNRSDGTSTTYEVMRGNRGNQS